MSVYSTQFFLGNANTAGSLYTVPAGKVAVLRDIDWRNYSFANTITALGKGGYYPISSGPMAVNGQYHLTTRLVFQAGESIDYVSTATGVHLSLAGYLFDA